MNREKKYFTLDIKKVLLQTGIASSSHCYHMKLSVEWSPFTFVRLSQQMNRYSVYYKVLFWCAKILLLISENWQTYTILYMFRYKNISILLSRHAFSQVEYTKSHGCWRQNHHFILWSHRKSITNDSLGFQ